MEDVIPIDFSIASTISLFLSFLISGIYIHKKKVKILKKPFYALTIWVGIVVASYTFILVVVPSFICIFSTRWESWAVTNYVPLYTLIGTLVVFVIMLYGTYHIEIK